MNEEMISPNSAHIREPIQGPLFEWYSSMIADCISQTMMATALFFIITWPWAACFWPPYYFMWGHNK